MRLPVAVLAAGALAACSGETPPDRQADTLPPAVAAPPPAGLAGRIAAPASAGRALTGSVSALKGDISGLSVRITDQGTVVDLPSDVLFEFDRAALTPAAAGALAKVAELIRRAPTGPIGVIGHTDAKGEDAYNQRLSEARARAVADWFGQQVGVRQRAFDVSGRGETAPIAPNATPSGADDPAGRARNRRVEVVLPNAPAG